MRPLSDSIVSRQQSVTHLCTYEDIHIYLQDTYNHRLQASIGSGADSQERLQRIEDLLPMKRVAQPMDIANAVWYLATDQSSFVTGTTLEVDGGRGI